MVCGREFDKNVIEKVVLVEGYNGKVWMGLGKEGGFEWGLWKREFEWRDFVGVGLGESENEKVMLEDMNEGDVDRFEWRDLVEKF